MNRDEQEMALWREAYNASMLLPGDGRNAEADEAVEAFRKRYPAEPTAPPAVWYDEPPFEKDGESHPCWICGEDDACAVHWSHYDLSPRWVYLHAKDNRAVPLAGRRVCPIAKPPEPATMSDTYDLRTSQYDHPERHRGQHTNGPAKLFVRRPNGRWYRVRIQTNAHAVRRMIAAHGFDHFSATHCDVLPQEPPQ